MSGGESVSTLSPSPQQRQRAGAFALLLACGCALAVPLATLRVGHSETLQLVGDTALTLLGLVVASALYLQFRVMRAPAVLALGSGFLLLALTTAPQLLRESQAAFIDLRLLFIADLSLPAATTAYVLLSRPTVDAAMAERTSTHVLGAITATVALAAFATWVTAVSAGSGSGMPAAQASFAWRVLATTVVGGSQAAAIGLLWKRRSSLLDLWLLVALSAGFMDVVLRAAAYDDASVSWHFARFYGLIGIACLTLVMLAENVNLFARFARLLHAPRTHRGGPEGVVDGIAEELNQPLCAITANADAIARLLEREQPDLAEVRAALADIVADAGRASETLRQAQRVVAVTQESPSLIDVGQLVGECLEQLRVDLLEQRVTCEVQTATPLPGIRGARQQLLQMLIHLVTNSMEALSGVPHRDRWVRLRTARHGDAVVIWVEDSGAGLPPRGQLRLAWCRRIVAAHGGELSAAAGEGGGVACRVLLPANS